MRNTLIIGCNYGSWDVRRFFNSELPSSQDHPGMAELAVTVFISFHALLGCVFAKNPYAYISSNKFFIFLFIRQLESEMKWNINLK